MAISTCGKSSRFHRWDMFQLHHLYDRIFDDIDHNRKELLRYKNLNDLEEKVNWYFTLVEDEKKKYLARAPLLSNLPLAIDYFADSQKKEFLDEKDYPEEKKQRLVDALHRFNRIHQNYRKFFDILKPHFNVIAKQNPSKPIRFLEIASGSGNFIFYLYSLLHDLGIKARLVGSDIVPHYIDRANRLAKEKKAIVEFRKIDALNLTSSFPIDGEDKPFDIVFIAQSLHHFSLGQLARIFAGAKNLATYGIIGIDGKRSLLTGSYLSFTAWWASLFSNDIGFFHDALISSLKLYPEKALAKMLSIAVPNNQNRVYSRGYYTVVESLLPGSHR